MNNVPQPRRGWRKYHYLCERGCVCSHLNSVLLLSHLWKPDPPPRHPQLQQVLAGQLLNQSFKYMDKSASRLGLSTHAVA